MKKIIKGKLYDTETAQEIGSIFHGDGHRDFHHYSEKLFRKRTGEYFLYGEGGPMSRYSVSCGQNQWSGGEKIIPLSYDAAKQWGEENLYADDFLEEFGPVSKSGTDERTTLSVSLDAATADRIRREAQEAGMTISALISSKF